MRDLTDNEKVILEYLETCYTGARMLDKEDESLNSFITMIRLERAIVAFNSDPLLSHYSVFNGKFLDNYFKENTSISDSFG